ncbi:MAG: hypothetical protein ACJASL_004242 [Paraglaciecola sp.]|jgi:hypothetical protein|tara:strand:- start:1854 stop:2099 length:246 start_codon:yes stop_codon:yes gene_type:complete
MKKKIISAFVLLAALNTGTALAGGCSMDKKQIDLIVNKSTPNMTEIGKVKTLLIETEKLNTAVGRSASVDALKETKGLLEI